VGFGVLSVAFREFGGFRADADDDHTAIVAEAAGKGGEFFPLFTREAQGF